MTTDYRPQDNRPQNYERLYLHFLYIARGSLSETQYFVHPARRLGYLSSAEADVLREQTKLTFACLHDLIRAVEKEGGKLSKVIALIQGW